MQDVRAEPFTPWMAAEVPYDNYSPLRICHLPLQRLNAWQSSM